MLLFKKYLTDVLSTQPITMTEMQTMTEPVKYAVSSEYLQLYLTKIAHVFLQQKLLTV